MHIIFFIFFIFGQGFCSEFLQWKSRNKNQPKINWKKKFKKKEGAEQGSPDIGKWDSGFGLGPVQRPENCASIPRRWVLLRPRVDAVALRPPRPVRPIGRGREPIWSIGDVSSCHCSKRRLEKSAFVSISFRLPGKPNQKGEEKLSRESNQPFFFCNEPKLGMKTSPTDFFCDVFPVFFQKILRIVNEISMGRIFRLIEWLIRNGSWNKRNWSHSAEIESIFKKYLRIINEMK